MLENKFYGLAYSYKTIYSIARGGAAGSVDPVRSATSVGVTF